MSSLNSIFSRVDFFVVCGRSPSRLHSPYRERKCWISSNKCMKKIYVVELTYVYSVAVHGRETDRVLPLFGISAV